MAVCIEDNYDLVAALGTENYVGLDTKEISDLKFLVNVLNERDRRLVVGFLATTGKHGSEAELAQAAGLDVRTVRRGCNELEQRTVTAGIRQSGGGRHAVVTRRRYQEPIKAIVKPETAGDPMKAIKWLGKSLRWIQAQLALKGVKLSINAIRKILKKKGYSLKSNVKRLALRQHPQRDEQFGHIQAMREQFLRNHQPVISVDTKKKELIGQFKNPGRTWQQEPIETWDHDFPSQAIGKLIPFGVYDIGRNTGHIFCGVSHDTPQFAVENIVRWWETTGRVHYSQATELLILCDGGGSNGYRPRAWKWHLQAQLADRLGLTVTVCHYPPGTSKWNPIEHRLFSFISITWAGHPLVSYDVALDHLRSTHTRPGLTVTAVLVEQAYPTGSRITDNQMKTLRLNHHETCPDWNYTIKPHSTS